MTIRGQEHSRGAARPDEAEQPDAGRAGNVVPLRRQPANYPQPRPDAGQDAGQDAALTPLWRELVGRQLRAERSDRGERIADVARRAGVAPQYLSELERGVKEASSEILAAVSGALGLSVIELARRVSSRPQPGRFRRGDGPVCLAA